MRKGREASYWCDVSAEMMSEEEKIGDNYVRHPPSYRSKKMNEFIQVLDGRAEKKGSTHPRIGRVLGSPRNGAVPSGAKSWIVRKDANTPGIQDKESDIVTEKTNDDFFSSNDEDTSSDDSLEY